MEINHQKLNNLCINIDFNNLQINDIKYFQLKKNLMFLV